MASEQSSMPTVNISSPKVSLEGGENCTPHYQGYLECYKQTSFKQLNSLLFSNLANIGIRRGSQKEAIDYCSKEKGRIKGP